jgi:hypothetical protein
MDANAIAYQQYQNPSLPRRKPKFWRLMPLHTNNIGNPSLPIGGSCCCKLTILRLSPSGEESLNIGGWCCCTPPTSGIPPPPKKEAQLLVAHAAVKGSTKRTLFGIVLFKLDFFSCVSQVPSNDSTCSPCMWGL